MILLIYTLVHVLISLVAIVSGFVWLHGLIKRKSLPGWTTIFLTTTLATSVTGFFFPFKGVTGAFIFGVITLIVLPLAIYALIKKRLSGGWRKVYVINSLIALYLNTFALVVQIFLKPLHIPVPPENAGFGITQILLLIVFIVLGTLAVRRFKPLAS